MSFQIQLRSMEIRYIGVLFGGIESLNLCVLFSSSAASGCPCTSTTSLRPLVSIFQHTIVVHHEIFAAHYHRGKIVNPQTIRL